MGIQSVKRLCVIDSFSVVILVCCLLVGAPPSQDGAQPSSVKHGAVFASSDKNQVQLQDLGRYIKVTETPFEMDDPTIAL